MEIVETGDKYNKQSKNHRLVVWKSLTNIWQD